MKEKSEKLLLSGLELEGCQITARQLEQFNAYYQIYSKWNAQMNLSAITEEEDFVVKHILDCAAALSFFSVGKRILDLGSGAGLPGMVLKILSPDLDITLSDVIEKKVNFLKAASKLLDLELPIYNSSQEKIEREFEVLTCRAFANLEKILKLAKKYLVKGGQILAYKGTRESIEAEIKPYMRKNMSLQPLKVPYLEGQRHLVQINL